MCIRSITTVSASICTLKEKLDKQRMTDAWSLCVKRHPALQAKIEGNKICYAKHFSTPIYKENENFRFGLKHFSIYNYIHILIYD